MLGWGAIRTNRLDSTRVLLERRFAVSGSWMLGVGGARPQEESESIIDLTGEGPAGGQPPGMPLARDGDRSSPGDREDSMSVRTLQATSSRRALRRDIELLRRMAGMLVQYWTSGARLRRAYRRCEARGWWCPAAPRCLLPCSSRCSR